MPGFSMEITNSIITKQNINKDMICINRLAGLFIIFCVSLFCIGNLDAAEKNQWGGFEPPPDKKYDWMQLYSGEWLKGELVSLYDFSVEFDSDELNLLTIDLDDIRIIRSAGPLSLRLENNNYEDETLTIVGVLELLDNAALVTVNDQLHAFERAQIVSIGKGTTNESDLWTGKVSFGANIKSGNSDIVDTNILANAKRRTANSRFVIDYAFNFSRTQDIETSNNHRLNSYYDRFFSRELFWRIYTTEYYRDTFKNIDDQLSLGSSSGYDLIRTSKTEWEISGGLGALYKRFVSVEPGQNIDNLSPYAGMGTRLDTEITKWMDILLDYAFQIVDAESGRFTHHLITTLSSDITGDLDLDVSFVWDRVREPQPAADGSVPENDDIQLIIGLGYEF